MNLKTKQLGIYCEKLCKNYLINIGYNILEVNYHSRYGEIDIIANDNQYLVFVEVKAREVNSIIRAYEAVDKRKMTKIIKTAYQYLSQTDVDYQPRFDIIEIYFFKGKLDNEIEINKINHIKNAFDLNFIDLDMKL